MPNFLKSSMDSKQVANTIKGGVLAVAGILLFVAKMLGFPLTELEVTDIATQLGLACGTLWTLYGITMKIVMFVSKKIEEFNQIEQ